MGRENEEMWRRYCEEKESMTKLKYADLLIGLLFAFVVGCGLACVFMEVVG